MTEQSAKGVVYPFPAPRVASRRSARSSPAPWMAGLFLATLLCLSLFHASQLRAMKEDVRVLVEEVSAVQQEQERIIDTYFENMELLFG